MGQQGLQIAAVSSTFFGVWPWATTFITAPSGRSSLHRNAARCLTIHSACLPATRGKPT
jgi:hypothetical protein